jgi:hypothetical protein
MKEPDMCSLPITEVRSIESIPSVPPKPTTESLDEESPSLPLFKLKKIEPNISFDGEWYQTSFYSQGEFKHAYTKSIDKARTHIQHLKSGC